MDTSPIVYLRHLEKLTAGKYYVTGEGGVLVTQERMADADAAKVDVSAKADAPDASNAPKINTPKIDVKKGMGKLCAVEIVLSRRVSLRQKSLCESQAYGGGSETGKFYAKKRQKRGNKSRRKTQIQHNINM